MVDIFARVSFGASGAPTLDAANSKGISKIVRNGTGDYTVTFGITAQVDNYLKVLSVSHVWDQTVNSGAAPGSPAIYIKSSSGITTGTLRLLFNSAGTATDPTSGDVVLLRIALSNSSAG